MFGELAIFPFQNILTLAAQNSLEHWEQLQILDENNNEFALKGLVCSTFVMVFRLAFYNRKKSFYSHPEKCLLCHLEFRNVTGLQIHLQSRLHQNRKKQRISQCLDGS